MRNPEDWAEIIEGGNYRFDRGFTGHEHLGQFGLINMPARRSVSEGGNGRMYDPHTARFLSPDLFVQDPSFTQSFNRYSYCVNNPLKFVDPGGYSENGVWDGDGPPRWMKRLLAQHRHSDGPGFWWEDFSAFSSGGGGIGGGGSGSYGRPGQYYQGETNGIGYKGVYYDWVSGTYRTTRGYRVVPVKNVITSSSDGVAFFRGFHIIGGGSWYTEDGVKALMTIIRAANGGGMPDWASDANTGVNAFMVGNGAKTGLLNYAVRTNYKSARTASQFNKLRPTQQAWRTTNTLGKT